MTLESELPEAVALITPDNEALGWALARRALEEYRGGTVLLLDCLPENTGVQARVEAAEAALIRGGATVLRWSETGEEELIRLDEEGALAQVVALEIGATEAAAQAKERAGSSAALYGVGVTSRIAAWLERGTISAVAAWSEYAAGYLAVDGAASNDGSNLLEELRVCYLLHRLTSSEKAPSGYQVLKMATRGSARLLGREDIGQLAVGKCADFFLVDSRRLELVGGAYSPADVLATVGLRGPVDCTVVNGRVVVKEGHLVTIDEEKTAADARKACGAYLAKA